MSGAIPAWWRLRTLREQRLLIIMTALAVLLFGWLLVVRPLADALEAAKADHAEAVDRLAQARARSARFQLSGPSRAAPIPVDAFLARTATAAGFVEARIAASGPIAATVGVDSARPQALFAWLRAMEEAGLRIETLEIRANQGDTLALQAAFRASRR